MKRSVEGQKLAAQINANNISQMARDFRDSRRVKLMDIEQNQRDKVDSELRKKEKSERLIKQLADAKVHVPLCQSGNKSIEHFHSILY
jgi:dGTP triphosphohydrolase